MSRDVAQRAMAKIRQFAADPAAQASNIKKLTEHPGYRLWVGDWRVVFLVDDSEMVVTVVKVGTRGGIYE